MTLTRELRTSIALLLAILLALTAFVWSSQPRAHASLATQILCLVDQVGDDQDGEAGIFPMFEEDCTGQGGEIIDWCPNLPGDQAQSELPCIPPGVDVCPNIDGLQATLPEGKVLEGGICVDAGNNGGGGSGADLSIAKTVSDTSPAPSSTVIYTITVTSSGPESAPGVVVSDMLPSGVLYVSDDSSGAYSASTGLWTVGTVASGTVATLHITATVMATSGVEVVNTASIADSEATDPNSDNNSATVTFTSTQDSQSGGGGNAQCQDGVDNDGDGDIDFPADDDCESITDDKEEQDSRNRGGGSRRNSSGGSNNNGGEVLGAQTGECPMYLTGYIRQGAANDTGEVAKLQVFLNAYEGNALQITGIYDAPTLAAVNAFQRKYASEVLEPWGLQGVTGYVYYTTQKQINTIYCEFKKDFPLSVSQIEEIADVREIQPQLRAQGATSARPAQGAAASRPATPAVGSVVLPTAQPDENATTTAQQQTAAAANASSTKGWFGRFTDWLFGR